MTITQTTEDLFNTDGHRVIVVQVNSLGYGSIGTLAKIRKELPMMFNEYHSICKSFNTFKLQFEVLGTFLAVKFKHSDSVLIFAFTLKFYTDTKYENDIEAWRSAMLKIKIQLQNRFRDTGERYSIHMLDRIGNGIDLTGVDRTKAAIEEVLSDSDIDIVYHESKNRQF